jgi:diguanylate cyclase (GGDEF)-like protein
MPSFTATREVVPGTATQDGLPSSPRTRRLFERRCERYLRRLLPGFCAVFGISVLADGMWSYLALSAQTPATLVFRLALVAIASFAYRMPRAGPPPARRTAFVYAVHAAALAIAARPLADGLTHAMPALFVWMIMAGLVEPRPGRCLRILAPTALLYAALGALMFPSRAAFAVWAGCVAAPALATALGSGTLRLREELWLRERQLLHACRYDSLSGALSRSYLTELAQHDLSLAKRHGRSLGVAMLDIDHFKGVNDTYGHAVGDAVIRALTSTCMRTLRATDYVGRLGGEEFACVFPETGAEEALACAERVRAAFAGQEIPGAPPELRCTVSIGIAVYRDERDWEMLLREADQALYSAKSGGRNRVVLAEPHPTMAGQAVP